MKKMIKPTAVLLAFILVSVVLIGLTYTVTAGPLAEQRAQMAAGPLLELMPDTRRTDEVYLGEDGSTLTHLVRCYDGADEFIGYVFTAAPIGFVGEIELMVAINPQGVIEGVQIVNHAETQGIGSHVEDDDFLQQFSGRSGILFGVHGATGPQEIDILAHATISMEAVVRGVNDAIAHFGGVDAPADTAQAAQAAYAPGIEELWPGTYSAQHINMAISLDAGGAVNGYVFYVSPQGHNRIDMAVAIDTQGIIQGIQILHHSETPNFGGWVLEDENFLQQFAGRSGTLTAVRRADGPQEIDTISHATLTVDGVLQGINDSIEFFNSLQRP